MTIKYKITRTINLEKLSEDIRNDFQEESREFMKDLIVGTIESGHSPVEGKGKYKAYSKSYAERKKGGRRSPVNMTDTGKMLRSLKVRKTKKGLSFFFTSPIAKFHDLLGAGNSKIIRRLLPRGNERFSRKIMDALIGLAESSVKRMTRSYNKR